MSVCHQYVQSDRNVNEETARSPWENCGAEKEFPIIVFDDQQDQRPGSGAQMTLRGSDETAATSKHCIINIE